VWVHLDDQGLLAGVPLCQLLEQAASQSSTDNVQFAHPSNPLFDTARGPKIRRNPEKEQLSSRRPGGNPLQIIKNNSRVPFYPKRVSFFGEV
jgi:hypothetical protein